MTQANIGELGYTDFVIKPKTYSVPEIPLQVLTFILTAISTLRSLPLLWTLLQQKIFSAGQNSSVMHQNAGH